MRSEIAYADGAGRSLLQKTHSYDWTHNQLRIDSTEAGVRKKQEVRTVPSDTLAVDGIAGVLRGLDFTGAKPLAAHLVASKLDITFEVRGRETIQTAAGVTECYKVELVPHVGLLGYFPLSLSEKRAASGSLFLLPVLGFAQ